MTSKGKPNPNRAVSGVKVGPYDYTVRPLGADASDDHHGTCCHTQLQIKLAEKQHDQTWLESLFHETGHCIFQERGLGVDFADEDKEERIVRAMASGYLCVLLENPDVLALIAARAGYKLGKKK